jgi:hypothetical protein
MDIIQLACILQANPELQDFFSYEATTKYIDLVQLLKPILSTLQVSYRPKPPLALPVNIHDFLKQCLGLTDRVGKLAWE